MDRRSAHHWDRHAHRWDERAHHWDERAQYWDERAHHQDRRAHRGHHEFAHEPSTPDILRWGTRLSFGIFALLVVYQLWPQHIPGSSYLPSSSLSSSSLNASKNENAINNEIFTHLDIGTPQIQLLTTYTDLLSSEAWSYLTGTNVSTQDNLLMPAKSDILHSHAPQRPPTPGFPPWTSDQLTRQWAATARYLRDAVETVLFFALKEANNDVEDLCKNRRWFVTGQGKWDWSCIKRLAESNETSLLSSVGTDTSRVMLAAVDLMSTMQHTIQLADEAEQATQDIVSKILSVAKRVNLHAKWVEEILDAYDYAWKSRPLQAVSGKDKKSRTSSRKEGRTGDKQPAGGWGTTGGGDPGGDPFLFTEDEKRDTRRRTKAVEVWRVAKAVLDGPHFYRDKLFEELTMQMVDAKASLAALRRQHIVMDKRLTDFLLGVAVAKQGKLGLKKGGQHWVGGRSKQDVALRRYVALHDRVRGYDRYAGRLEWMLGWLEERLARADGIQKKAGKMLRDGLASQTVMKEKKRGNGPVMDFGPYVTPDVMARHLGSVRETLSRVWYEAAKKGDDEFQPDWKEEEVSDGGRWWNVW